jgi:recombination protein RecA
MIVNQTREKIGGLIFGSNRTTPGGNALKFHASVRLELFSGKSIKDGDDHVGKQITMMATKTKVGGKPWAKAKVRLYYDTGFNNVWSTINHAKIRKFVPKEWRATEENYLAALKALGWNRGFAVGGLTAPGDVEDSLTDEED